MDDNTQKDSVLKLINAHKLSMILVPLIEAVEINKRSGQIEGLHVSDLLAHVIDVGTDLYHGLLTKDDSSAIVEAGIVADKLYLTLAKALRNSIVLYNSASLSLMKDEFESLFNENVIFISKYQNDTETILNKGYGAKSSLSPDIEALGHVTSSLSQMFMPFWLFHTNLYTSGLVSVDELVVLNKRSSSYMVKVIDKLMTRMKESHGEFNQHFKVNSLFVCSEMVSSIVYEFHGKLIKNKKMLDDYMCSPETVLAKLVPAILANFGVMTSCISDTVKVINKK